MSPFNLESSPLMQRIVELKENGYADKDSFEYVLDVLEVAGDITANTIPLFYVFKNLLDNVFFIYICYRKRGCYAPKKLEQGGRIHFLIFMHQTVCGSIPYSRRIFGFRSKKFATIIKILLKSKAFKC